MCVWAYAGIGLVHWFVSAFRIFHEPEMYRWSRSVFSFFFYFCNEQTDYAVLMSPRRVYDYMHKHYTLQFMLSIKSH